jgi:hypothetical protein
MYQHSARRSRLYLSICSDESDFYACTLWTAFDREGEKKQRWK